MEGLYQEEEKELEYIPNETTIAQLFVLQEVVMYYIFIAVLLSHVYCYV